MRLYSQIYECDLPANCRRPIELARSFFAGRGVKSLRGDGQSIRFSRGSWLGSLFAVSDLRVRHGGYIHLDVVTCTKEDMDLEKLEEVTRTIFAPTNLRILKLDY